MMYFLIKLRCSNIYDSDDAFERTSDGSYFRLTEQIDRYKERDKDGPVTLEEFDEVKWENERVKADCERLKKLIEQKHKKMKVLHQQNQSTVKALEERLAQEEVRKTLVMYVVLKRVCLFILKSLWWN